MSPSPPNGTRRTIRGKPCVYYEGHWIRRYDYSSGTLADRKHIIDLLARRVFHHVEPGINTPGYRLEEIRAVYDAEQEPARKRIKGAMLAGALLNRGRDILTRIVDLEKSGVEVDTSNELFTMCGECFAEALALGRNIKLACGEEGLDELWGEPFKAFSLPLTDFYSSRYIKLAQTMSQIDELVAVMLRIVRVTPPLREARPLLNDLRDSAKAACETLRTDSEIFEIWPEFVASKEHFEEFQPVFPDAGHSRQTERYRCGLELLRDGGRLLSQLAVVRVRMPVSVKNFMDRCEVFFLTR